MPNKKKSKKEFKPCPTCDSKGVCKRVGRCLKEYAEEKLGGKKPGTGPYPKGKQPGY